MGKIIGAYYMPKIDMICHFGKDHYRVLYRGNERWEANHFRYFMAGGLKVIPIPTPFPTGKDVEPFLKLLKVLYG